MSVNAAIACDFFGTLVEIDEDRPMMWQILKSHGYSCPPALEAVWNSDGFDGFETPSTGESPNYDTWRMQQISQMLELSGVARLDRKEVLKLLMENDRSWTVKARLGAKQFVSQARDSGLSLGICSNWDYSLDPYIEQAALGTVDAIVTSAEVGARKPHPRPFLEIADRLRTKPTNVFFLGDNWRTDIVGSLRVGMKPIWITQCRENPLPQHIRKTRSLRIALDWILKNEK